MFSKIRSSFYITISLIGMSLFSCNRDLVVSAEGSSIDSVGKDQLSILIDKAKFISSDPPFIREQVTESFPEGDFKGAEFMGMHTYKIDEQYTLMLELVSPSPDSFRIAPAAPNAFDERPTGVITEIRDDSVSAAEYDPPEIPKSISPEKIIKKASGYRRLILIDADYKTIYDSEPIKPAVENKQE